MTSPHSTDKGIKKMLLTAEDYQQMGKAGIFANKPRVELINGELYTMSPISPQHSSHVDKINAFFVAALLGKAQIRTQSSIRTDVISEPEPDITILKYKEDFYLNTPATNKDVYLIIEVAVYSVENDRTVKLSKYAEADIPEYWIVIPKEGIIEAYRSPKNGVYQHKDTYKKDDVWVFNTFNLQLKGENLLI
ncbi:MAG: Uma2 family endonuclease [Bacteroidota bacterium]